MLPSTDCFLFELSYRKESKHTDMYIFKNMSMLDFFRYLYTRKDFRVYYNDILAKNRFDEFMLEFPVTLYSEHYKTQCMFRIIQTHFSFSKRRSQYIRFYEMFQKESSHSVSEYNKTVVSCYSMSKTSSYKKLLQTYC